ncbi:hypothetical protein [Halomonas salifodinae]|uniref:hypothetical protein n=1 Tax=Halomonas salifodinae TaxID=438745 RepID=UPI0033BBE8BA
MSITTLSRGTLLGALLLPAAALAAEGHDLVFQGDASFQGPHGGQAIAVALVEAESGEVVAHQEGSVAGEGEMAFAFEFPGALMAGTAYEVHYWIDSNFGGGSEGVCDAMSHDHQWRVALDAVEDDLTHTEDHAPGRMDDVCGTFMAE